MVSLSLEVIIWMILRNHIVSVKLGRVVNLNKFSSVRTFVVRTRASSKQEQNRNYTCTG